MRNFSCFQYLETKERNIVTRNKMIFRFMIFCYYYFLTKKILNEKERMEPKIKSDLRIKRKGYRNKKKRKQ